jgi:chitin disaccharide deacetylase
MCQASIQAFQDLWQFGTITSGAVMVPCPWFPAVAKMCREQPDMDMGVHATLNSEWDSYRWRPLSTLDTESGLLDEEGYFHHWQPDVYQHAKPEAVAAEINTQIDRAIAAGIDVTHVDSHMGTIMSPLFIQLYIQAATVRFLPNMLPRLDAVGIDTMGISQADLQMYEPVMQQLIDVGVPMLEGLVAMPLMDSQGQLETAKELLGNLPEGITHFILHPSVDTPELRAIAWDWQSRVANYETFMSDDLKKFIEDENLILIGYRHIRDAMRKG